MKYSAILCSVLLLAIAASAYAQCAATCDGNTPICSGTTCVACTSDSECWAVSSNALVCNTTSGACGNCTSSSSCPDELPICSAVTSQCTVCNVSAECADRVSGTVCNVDTLTCEWCTSDAECAAGYGETSKCQNITTGVRKCSVAGPAALPVDPNNINGIITAYVIICIVLLVLFVMFITCGTSHPSPKGRHHLSPSTTATQFFWPFLSFLSRSAENFGKSNLHSVASRCSFSQFFGLKSSNSVLFVTYLSPKYAAEPCL